MSVTLVGFFLLLLLALALAYALGLAFTAPFRFRLAGYFQHFVRLCFGMSVSLAAYAIMATHGNTVMLLVPLALAGLGIALRRMPSLNAGRLLDDGGIVGPPAYVSFWQIGLLLALGATFLFVIRLPLVVDVTGATVGVPYHDYVFYSRLTYPLSVLGVESPVIDPVYGHLLSPQPYHFYEIWLNGLLVRLTGLSSMLMLNLVTYPLLVSVVLVGFAAITEHYFRSKWAVLALAVGALFITNIGLTFITVPFIKAAMSARMPPLPYHPKEAPVFLFVLLGFALFQRRYIGAAGWAWACAPVVYISTLPGVVISMAALGLYLLVRRKFAVRQLIALAGPVAALAMGIALFYGLNSLHQTEPSTTKSFATYLVKPHELTTAFHILVGTNIIYGLHYGLYFGLVLLLLLAQRRNLAPYIRQNEPNLVLLALLYSSTVLVRTALYHYVDCSQFMLNLLLPSLAVVILMLLCTALKGASRQVQVLGVAGLWLIVGGDFLLSSAQSETGSGVLHYDKRFMAQVHALAPQLSQNGAFIKADEEYTSVMKMHTGGQTPGLYISLFRNNQPLVSLSQMDVDSVSTDPRFARDSALAAQFIKQSTIYRFVTAQKESGKYTDLDHAKAALVAQEHINFICLSPMGQLPAALRPLVRITLVDPISRERLCLLRTK